MAFTLHDLETRMNDPRLLDSGAPLPSEAQHLCEQALALLERGDIYFLYTPRVGRDDPAGLDDVQRFPAGETAQTAGMFRDLHLDRLQHPAAPLLAGDWE